MNAEMTDAMNALIKYADGKIKAFKIEGDEKVIASVAEGNKFFNIVAGTDVYPNIISKVINSRTIEVESMSHITNFDDPSNLIFMIDDKPVKTVFTKRKNGRWVEKGSRSGLKGYISNKPKMYLDPDF